MSILVAPALIDLGVPLIAAHFFILYMSVSGFITPPVCLAAYIAGGMVGKSGITVGFRAMRFGIVCYLIPFVCLFAPSLLLVGTVPEILQAAVTAIIGVVLLSAGFEGYLVGETGRIDRICYLTAGFLMFCPGLATDLAGLVLAFVALSVQLLRRRAGEAVL